MSELLLIALTAAIVSNFWLALAGHEPTRAFDAALPIGAAVWAICALAVAVATATAQVILAPQGLSHFGPLVSLLVCAGAAVLAAHLPVGARDVLAAEVWLVTAAAALLAIAVQHAVASRGVGPAVAVLGAGTAFCSALALLGGVTERLERANVPAWLRGPALRLAAAALLSLAFMGWSGIGGL